MPASSGSSGSTRRRLLGAAVSVLLFAGAVFVLHSELREHSLPEILAELRKFPPLRLLLALAATLLSFLALAGYDAVSLSALGRRLAFRRVAYAGLLASAGLAFALQPVLVPGFLRLPLRSVRPLGFVCLAVVAGYLAWSSRPGGDLRLWSWELPRPTLRRALAQIAVSGADWVFSGAALYVLLPHRVPFHVFFAVFLLGQIVGLVAQIPAGLGVFEAVMLVGLTPAISTPAILVGLVGYRLVYFLLPLVLATGVWVLREIRRWYRATR